MHTIRILFTLSLCALSSPLAPTSKTPREQGASVVSPAARKKLLRRQAHSAAAASGSGKAAGGEPTQPKKTARTTRVTRYTRPKQSAGAQGTKPNDAARISGKTSRKVRVQTGARTTRRQAGTRPVQLATASTIDNSRRRAPKRKAGALAEQRAARAQKARERLSRELESGGYQPSGFAGVESQNTYGGQSQSQSETQPDTEPLSQGENELDKAGSGGASASAGDAGKTANKTGKPAARKKRRYTRSAGKPQLARLYMAGDEHSSERGDQRIEPFTKDKIKKFSEMDTKTLVRNFALAKTRISNYIRLCTAEEDAAGDALAVLLKIVSTYLKPCRTKIEGPRIYYRPGYGIFHILRMFLTLETEIHFKKEVISRRFRFSPTIRLRMVSMFAALLHSIRDGDPEVITFTPIVGYLKKNLTTILQNVDAPLIAREKVAELLTLPEKDLCQELINVCQEYIDRKVYNELRKRS